MARQMSSETIDYYNQNAADFAQATEQIDMTALYVEFLPLIKRGGHILDAGCGSGRDALYFKRQGFSVTAFDASDALVNIARKHLEQNVEVKRFEQLDERDKYDGIWCCASLLHVELENLADIFNRLKTALKTDAVLYVSFKFGNNTREVKGRRFTDMDDIKLKAALDDVAGLGVIKTWQTKDLRADRNQDVWFNALLTKLAQ